MSASSTVVVPSFRMVSRWDGLSPTPSLDYSCAPPSPGQEEETYLPKISTVRRKRDLPGAGKAKQPVPTTMDPVQWVTQDEVCAGCLVAWGDAGSMLGLSPYLATCNWGHGWGWTGKICLCHLDHLKQTKKKPACKWNYMVCRTILQRRICALGRCLGLP